MPTYEYACEACGHAFEHFQTMTSRKKRKCPECGKPKLIRLVGAGAGLIFKGSGFYETDYKRAGSGGSGGSDKSGGDSDKGAESGSQGDSKGDSKSSSESASGESSKQDTGAGNDA